VARRPDVLRSRRDFDRLYKRGRSVADRYVILFFIPNGCPSNRKAFLASKKVGGAVARNRARRLMRESLRLMAKDEMLKGGYDLLFIARNTIGGRKRQEVEASMKNALKRGNILK